MPPIRIIHTRSRCTHRQKITARSTSPISIPKTTSALVQNNPSSLGKYQFEAAARTVNIIVGFQFPPVRFQDLFCDIQSEPDTPFAPGKKWFEDLIEIFF